MHAKTLCVVRKASIWLSISVACEGQPESRWVRGVQKIFLKLFRVGGGAGILIWEFANRGGGANAVRTISGTERIRIGAPTKVGAPDRRSG